MPKISIDKTMQDIVSINNQLIGLTLLLKQKKALMAKYFDKTGEKSIANDEATVYVQERTNIEYDVEEICSKLNKNVTDQFVDTERNIADWSSFVSLCKSHGITAAQLRPFIIVKRTINQAKLNELYEKGKITLSNLQGCYSATVKKSVALRMKNIDQEIKIANKE